MKTGVIVLSLILFGTALLVLPRVGLSGGNSGCVSGLFYETDGKCKDPLFGPCQTDPEDSCSFYPKWECDDDNAPSGCGCFSYVYTYVQRLAFCNDDEGCICELDDSWYGDEQTLNGLSCQCP